MKICYIFIGEVGSGKSTHAARFAKHMHLPHLKENLSSEQIYNQLNKEQAIVISKNLYSNKERIQLQQELEQLGCKVIYYWVKVSLIQNIKQVLTKQNPITHLYRWLTLHFKWQNPIHCYRTVWWRNHGFFEEN